MKTLNRRVLLTFGLIAVLLMAAMPVMDRKAAKSTGI